MFYYKQILCLESIRANSKWNFHYTHSGSFRMIERRFYLLYMYVVIFIYKYDVNNEIKTDIILLHNVNKALYVNQCTGNYSHFMAQYWLRRQCKHNTFFLRGIRKNILRCTWIVWDWMYFTLCVTRTTEHPLPELESIGQHACQYKTALYTI